MFQNITLTDLQEVEQFACENLADMVDAETNETCATLHEIQLQKRWFFGGFSSDPSKFIFLPDEKVSISSISLYVQSILKNDPEHYTQLDHEENLFESVFGLVFGCSKSICFSSFNPHTVMKSIGEENGESTMNVQTLTANEEPKSQTHHCLKMLFDLANQNYSRTKPGFRFTDTIKSLCTFIRLIGGTQLYVTIHRNFELAIPSISTMNRFITQNSKYVHESQLQVEGLLKYLTERNLPKIVCLSEDATRIEGRIEYDSRTNQLVGFIAKMNPITGMPIPDSFPATNIAQMVNHFTANTVANYVNVVMAQPLAKYPPFCILAYASNPSFTATEVILRWNYIVNELAKYDVKVLTFSSDSDPRFNSAMRTRSSLGRVSNIFDNFSTKNADACGLNSTINWFCVGDSFDMGQFDIQDKEHVGTKMRNIFNRTKRNPYKLPIGKFYIQWAHLMFLLKNYPKDEHNLSKSVLNSNDRQNYDSVLRITDMRVIELLENKVPGSNGTVMILKLMRNMIEAFSMNNLSPLERISKMWYTVFMVRLWRGFIKSKKELKLKNNFLTQNCYTCIEINGHNLVRVIMYLKENNMPQLFLPFLYSSQPCESFFRLIRSFTTTYSTKANCSMKEICGRIDKIHLINDITENTNFIYPRACYKHVFPDQIEYKLPTKGEIFVQIEQCRKQAASDAIEMGLLNKTYSNDSFSCQLMPIEMKPKSDRKLFCHEPIGQKIQIRRLALRNFAYKFVGKAVPSDSPYVEVNTNSKQRDIYLKRSVVWLLRPDGVKLSSDRLIRVKTTINEPKSIEKPLKNKNKKFVKKKRVKKTTKPLRTTIMKHKKRAFICKR